MARHRKIDVRIWGDEKFRRLSPPPPCGQSLLFYLLTTPLTGSLPGLFRAGAAGMAEELGWSTEAFREAFAEVSGEGIATADWSARLVWIPKAITYNVPESPNVIRSWRSQWDELPECDLKRQAYQQLRAFVEGMAEGFLKAFDEAIARPSPKAMANQEQEQEQEQEPERMSDLPGLKLEPVESEPTPDVDAVWSAYLEGRASRGLGPPPPKLTHDRRALIRRRLKEHDVGHLVNAVRGIWLRDFNVQGGHTGIELALRGEKLDGYAATGAAGKRVPSEGGRPGPGPREPSRQGGVQALDDYHRRQRDLDAMTPDTEPFDESTLPDVFGTSSSARSA